MVKARRVVGRAGRQRVAGIGERAVARPRNRQLVELVLAHVQAAAALWPAQPLLTRGGVEGAAECLDIYRHGADPLRCIEQHGNAGPRQGLVVHDAAPHPGHVRAGDQLRVRRHLAGKLRERDDSHLDAVQVLGSPERRQQTRVLLVAGDDLVAWLQVESREHRVDTVGGRAGQGDAGRVAAEHARVRVAQSGREIADRLHVRLAAAPIGELEVDPLANRVAGSGRKRALGPGVEVGGPLQDRKLGSEFASVAHRGAYLMHRRAQPSGPNTPVRPNAVVLEPNSPTFGTKCAYKPQNVPRDAAPQPTGSPAFRQALVNARAVAPTLPPGWLTRAHISRAEAPQR